MYLTIPLSVIDEKVTEQNAFILDDLSHNEESIQLDIDDAITAQYEMTKLPSPLSEEGRKVIAGIEKLAGKTVNQLSWEDLAEASGGEHRDTELLSTLLHDGLSHEMKDLPISGVKFHGNSLKLGVG